MKSEGSSIIPWAQHDWHIRVEPAVVGSESPQDGFGEATAAAAAAAASNPKLVIFTEHRE